MATITKSPFKPTDDDDLFIIDSLAKIKAAAYEGGEGNNTIRITKDLNLSPIEGFVDIQNFEIASGRKVVISGEQLQQIANTASDNGSKWQFSGVPDGVNETLVVQLTEPEAEDDVEEEDDADNRVILDLSGDANNLDPFNGVSVKILGTALEEFVLGSESAESVSGLAGNDDLSGNGGNDTLNGGGGNDTLDGGAGDDKLVGGAGDDEIYAGAGDDNVSGGAGADIITGEDGNDYLAGDAGDDSLDGGAGADTLAGGAGIDTLEGDAGNDVLAGGAGNDVIDGGDGDDTLDGGAGDDVVTGGAASAGDENVLGNKFLQAKGSDTLLGGTGNDTFYINKKLDGVVTIDGGTRSGGQDWDVNFVTNQFLSSVGTKNATDTIVFTKSGDYSEDLTFKNIEAIKLASGVSITLSNEQLETAFDSFSDSNPSATYNPGLHFYGVAGGKTETVNVTIEYETVAASNLIPSYVQGDLQFDDFDVADLFHDVQLKVDGQTGSVATDYFRFDGSKNNDYVVGSNGADNMDGRIGNDTLLGGTGNDVLKGQGGADSVDGGAGNDIMLITSFATPDGNDEWVSGDVINGGTGTDTLRITAGSTTTKTIALNNDNFKNMEVVEVGATSARTTNVESSGLQILNDHYYHRADTTVTNIQNVTVDASSLTTNGLTFVGNASNNTFIGTSQADTFVGNGGNDVFTGGNGADIFQFGNVHSHSPNNTTNVYDEVNAALTGTDIITDFTSGNDKFHLDNDFFTAFGTPGSIAAGNLAQGAGAVAADADDFLVFDSTTNALYYDADGSGVGAAFQIATLTGVTTLADTDFIII